MKISRKQQKKTIIVCEKLIEFDEIKSKPGKAQLPMQTTDAVVKVPFGAHPTSCYPSYTFDPNHIMTYLDTDFKSYKQKYITGKSHNQYLEESGGVQTILNILL